MAVGTLGYAVVRLSLPVTLLRRWRLRVDANAWAEAYGRDAIAVIRQRIAGAHRQRERRRLYRLHDEIARRDPDWASDRA